MTDLKLLLGAVAATVALGACNLESTLDDLNQEAIDAAFDTVKQEAESQGGAAAKVERGEEVTIEVTNPESLIFGATVKVPADALPADVDLATVSVFHFPVMEPATSALAAHGNGAKVTLTKLPGGEEVLPIAALTISLPVTKDSKKPIDQIVLGALNKDNGQLVAVENARSDAAKKHAVGDTKGLSMPFIASWEVEYDGGPADEGEFIVKVTRSGETACIGAARINPDMVTAGITDAGGGWYKFELNIMTLGPSLTVSDVEATSYGEPANGASITNADTFQFQCGTEVFAYNNVNTKWSLTTSEFEEESQSAAAAGTNHVGTVRIKGEFDYTAPGGEQVQMAFDTVKSGFNWYTNP